MPITANARRWDAGGVLVWLPASDGGCKHRVLPPAAKPPHPPPPQGEGGRGGGGAPTTAPKRPKGKGRRRPGREGPAPADAGAARPTGPRRSEATPPRRAATGRRKPHRPNQTKQPVLFGWRREPPTVNKTSVLLGSSGGCRAELQRGVLRSDYVQKVLRNGLLWLPPWGGTTTPPHGGDL